LNLPISEDGLTWRKAGGLERQEDGEFSYSAIIQTSDGLVHMTWTWKRQRIRHVVLALLMVLGLAGWRYGWPPRSRETTVYPLEEIDWYTAARLAPESIQPAGGGRYVYLLEGSLSTALFGRRRYARSRTFCVLASWSNRWPSLNSTIG
jgi:hypothetical protein